MIPVVKKTQITFILILIKRETKEIYVDVFSACSVPLV